MFLDIYSLFSHRLSAIVTFILYLFNISYHTCPKKRHHYFNLYIYLQFNFFYSETLYCVGKLKDNLISKCVKSSIFRYHLTVKPIVIAITDLDHSGPYFCGKMILHDKNAFFRRQHLCRSLAPQVSRILAAVFRFIDTTYKSLLKYG